MLRKKIRVKTLQGTPFFLAEDEHVGRGSFGTVVRAYSRDEPSRELVAKVIPLDPDNIESIRAELKVLKQIPSHPNLVNCLKLQVSSENNFYLIMEYCNGGTFENYIDHNHNCSEELVWRFLRDFCAGYRVLYDCHVIHRDIKPENILLHNATFKIADFGLCRKINHHSIEQNLSVKGTPLYMAPELQAGSHGCSKLDMFSLGTVLYRLAYNGAFPFFQQNRNYSSVAEYFEHLRNTDLRFPRYPKRSKEFEHLLARMLAKAPENRLEWKELFEHEKMRMNRKQQGEGDGKQNQQFSLLRNSLVEIGRSSAKVDLVSEPFNNEESIEHETKRILEFTQFATNLQVISLEMYCMRKKIMIELIRHLNQILKNCEDLPKGSPGLRKHIRAQFGEIIQEGQLYCLHSLTQMQQIIGAYSKDVPGNCAQALLTSLSRETGFFEEQLKLAKVHKSYEYLKYENSLYDFLIEYADRPVSMKEALKIPTGLMMDIYDGLLKLESMFFLNEKGRVEAVEIELEDAELDKIDYRDLRSYGHYLRKANEVTVYLVEAGLARMGLIIR